MIWKALVLAGTAAIALASPATAETRSFTLQGVTFQDGGTASGSFEYDTTVQRLTDWNITTTTGTLLPGHQFTLANSQLFGMNILSANSFLITNNLPYAVPYINFAFTSAFAGGGTIAFRTGLDAQSSWECNNCGSIRYVTAGVASTAAVPEPATWAMMIGGFGLLGAAARRRAAAKVTYA